MMKRIPRRHLPGVCARPGRVRRHQPKPGHQLLHGRRRQEGQRRRLGHRRPQRGRLGRHHRQPAQDPGPRLRRAAGTSLWARAPSMKRTARPTASCGSRRRPRSSPTASSINTASCSRRTAAHQRNRKSDVTDGGIGYMLRRLVAEKAKSAREAVTIAGGLVEKFGYTGSGRTYTLADKNEAWMMAIIQGRHWFAQRVPDDEVGRHPQLLHHPGDRPEATRRASWAAATSSNTPKPTAGTTRPRTAASISRRPSPGPPRASWSSTAIPSATGAA